MTAPAPLNWSALVEEALRRRRAEGLTQKEHAALAGVSVPTLIAFDRGQTTLSLAKAIDILNVLGLVAETTPADIQDAFVAAAEARWAELVADLPGNTPARMPDGHYAFDYHIAGATAVSGKAMWEALSRAGRQKHTGWPPFWVPSRPAIAPYSIEGGVECWLGRPDAERAFRDAAHSDFWQVSLDGRAYLRRGYLEDSADVLAPATIFDLTLPIWRTGEVLLHAHRLAAALAVGDAAEIRVRVRFAGLAGRHLTSWANPHREISDDHRSRIDSAAGAVTCSAAAVAERLPDLVRELLVPVYERFEFFELPPTLVAEELGRLRKTRFD